MSQRCKYFVADDKFLDVIRVLETQYDDWKRFPHVNFPKFDLKWSNYTKIQWHKVTSTQIVNHFHHAIVFSQKHLFARALYAYQAANAEVDIDSFFPRTFDLSQKHERVLWKQCFLYTKALQVLKQSAMHDDLDHDHVQQGRQFIQRLLHKRKQLQETHVNVRVHNVLEQMTNENDHDQDVGISTTSIHAMLCELKQWDPQYDAVDAWNMWIVKPATLSQGRGIQLITSMDAMATMLSDQDEQWIVQKYIETPFVRFQHGRKFDVRQWVLITSLDPLHVYWYHDCYLRFCSQRFTMDDASAFVHLSNYSVQQHATETSEDFELMWSSAHAKQQFQMACDGRDVWNDTIQPAMKHAARMAIKAVVPQLETKGVR